MNLYIIPLSLTIYCVFVFPQVLPQEVLQTESGELSEVGKAYSPPRVLLEALGVVCSVAGQWNDTAEADKIAMEILVVTHHPSIGLFVYLLLRSTASFTLQFV